ncbi:hypothetical protein HDIA_0629 [Hartmannibacter diazotrophicus]|uniref:Carbon monoxide dehydrogenase subunit G (CoxG) n=1 Tax=Hartmannibacter diazotrophicus TaxID=1482074 RepID=A0A2C9D1P9_9HYPH|nr:carbon monoxide dehydrogenase subunit G [Hartmannibacter diazotrophicus]SON54170.1 hypothetical protein HDIA_0629 [Hartmannibacter diazotrophicus]
MDMTGEYRIPASRDAVWAALNDPEVLKACIPGCESLEKDGDDLKATVVAKIGPVKAKFAGKVSFENVNPPVGYTIAGEGSGGVAGFAKGGADVALAEDGAETILTYTAKAQVGGKLAQLGSRLIDSTARKMADEFFGAFSQKVGTPVAAPAAAEAPKEPAEETVLEHAVHKAVEVEHQVEAAVEEAAAKSGPSGPMLWGLIALGIVIVILLYEVL